MVSGGFRDYFKTLGLDRKSSESDIKRAFRKLARKYHPDVNPGNAEAEAKFKQISEAYEVLSDPEKRRKYEQFGQYWNQSGGISSGTNARTGFDVDFGSYGNFDDFVNDLLGRFGGGRTANGFTDSSSSTRNQSQMSINLDAEIKLNISFQEAFRGTERTLSVNDERVQVKIPIGIKSGSRLRIKGKGNLQPGTGRRGDLYLNIVVEKHSIWRLDGDQLKGELPVTFDEISLGAIIQVVTPDGDAQIHIPAGTLPGQSLRLKSKGWPLKSGRGDLIFSLKLQLPDEWTQEELELLEKLRQFRSIDPRKGLFKSAKL